MNAWKCDFATVFAGGVKSISGQPVDYSDSIRRAEVDRGCVWVLTWEGSLDALRTERTLLDWLGVECPENEEGRIQKAKAAVQSNRDGRVVKSLERRVPDGR